MSVVSDRVSDPLRITMLLAWFLGLWILFQPTALQGEVIDGQWNGKPWDFKKLQEGVAQNNAEALAEWAYCSYYGENGVKCNDELIYKRSKAASEGGSILGECMLARCFVRGVHVDRNPEKYHAMVEKILKKSDHPFAEWSLGRCYSFGMGVERDIKRGYEIMLKAYEDGVLEAYTALGYITATSSYEVYGIYDPDAARAYVKEAYSKFESVSAAVFCCNYYADREDEIGSEMMKSMVETLRKSFRLGHPDSITSIASLLMNEGDRDQAIAYFIKGAKAGSVRAYIRLIRIIERSRSRRDPVISTDVITLGEFAGLAYNAGARSNQIGKHYINHISSKTPPEKILTKIPLITEIGKKALKTGYCDIHDQLGTAYMMAYFEGGGSKDYFKRGMSHYIYHSVHTDYNIHWVASCYFLSKKKPEIVNLPKAYAAAKTAMLKSSGAWKTRQKQIVKQCLAKMNDEQKKEAEELFNKGYPTAEKYRRDAFNYLIKVGDLPENEEFQEH